MARSLSFAAYRALARRTPHDPPDLTTPRPDGALIWGHATSGAEASALVQLMARLSALRSRTHMLLTLGDGVGKPDHIKPDTTILRPVPAEHEGAIAAFLDHWRPDLCLWTGGHLRPLLIDAAGERGIAMLLIDAEETAFDAPRMRWLPDVGRRSMARFETVLAASANAAQRVLKLGVAPERVTVTGPLREGTPALPCNEPEREELAQSLTGRPVWLAAMVQPGELDTILEAHRVSTRGAHRQLLILVPDDENAGDGIAAQMTAAGLRVAQWSNGDWPVEATQVLLADTRGEMGLWYRIAPITFMGSSLVQGHGGRDPFEPAALGSAILYGPNVGRYLPEYSRLASAGAARIVKDANTLAGAITRLSAPDQAATMAHAAWEVASAGAEVTDQVLDMVQDQLDMREAG